MWPSAPPAWPAIWSGPRPRWTSSRKISPNIVQDNKVADTTSLASGFQNARAKLATLEKAATAAEPDSADLSKAVEFAKNVASVPQPLLDRIGDLDDKRDTFHNLMTNNPSLATADIAKRFDEALQSLAAALVRLTACQVEQKELDAGEAEGGWNLQALRCDQIIEDGRDEASYLATKEDPRKAFARPARPSAWPRWTPPASRSAPPNAVSRRPPWPNRNSPTKSASAICNPSCWTRMRASLTRPATRPAPPSIKPSRKSSRPLTRRAGSLSPNVVQPGAMKKEGERGKA